MSDPEASRTWRWLFPLGALASIAFGVFWRREGLLTGFVADDIAQIGMLDGHYVLSRSPFNLFNFSDGTVAETRKLMHAGFYPWWTHPEIRLSMFRPLASAMIWLDHRVFGDQALAYHLHSLLWWCAMLVTIAALYRRFLPVPVALLALAIVALDETHGVLFAWIANRSALVSTTLSVVAFLAYVRWRRTERARSAIAVVGWLALAFLFGEYTLCAVGYFLAYEWFRGSGSLLARARALLPVFAPTAVWFVVRAALDHGPQHSGVYLDPFGDPAAFALAAVQRVPVLVADLMLAVRAEYWTFGFPWTFAMHHEGWVGLDWFASPAPWRAVHVWVGVAALLVAGALAAATLRATQNRDVRWFALGSALSVLPVIGSFPSSRLVLVPLIGFAAVLATFVVERLAGLRARLDSGRRAAALGGAALAVVLTAYHVTVPAWLTRVETLGLYHTSQHIRDAVLGMRVDDAKLARQRVVVLAALEGGTSMYIPMTRRRFGRTLPRACWTLSIVAAPYVLTRVADNAFTIKFTDVFTMLASAPEQLLRGPSDPFRVGDTVDVGGMRVTVRQLMRGRPRALHVEFDTSLDDPSLLFVVPGQDAIKPFSLPRVGESVTVPVPAIPTGAAT
jgi:hypothetical protein